MIPLFSNFNDNQNYKINQAYPMFVINFDFSSHILPLEILTINLPIFITQLLTYPLQRIQTLILSTQPIFPKNQIQQYKYLFKNMWGIQGFPKILHGMKFSFDYTGTMMTSKFLMFDFLTYMTTGGNIQQANKAVLLANCYIANVFSTVLAQIAFNYQILASSLPIDKSNMPEIVTLKMKKYTQKNKFPIFGLQYTVPASFLNTTIELIVLNQMSNVLTRFHSMENSYILSDLFTAFLIFTLTGFSNHYVFQRQVQLCLNMKKNSLQYVRGLIATLIRQNCKGLLLFGSYLAYFQYKTKNQLSSIFAVRRQRSDQPMPYRKR